MRLRPATSAPQAGTTQGTEAPRRLAWLDVLRGLAALSVVFNHFGYFVPPRLQVAVYHWMDPGEYGVFVFFIISGYIVPASLERKGSVRTFWVSRFFRLYPLYLLAVGFALLLWEIGFSSLRGEGADPATSVFSQLLMMSNVLAGKNLPNVVWSLSYEMIFYLLLTALFLLRAHRRSSRYALLLAVAAVALGGVLPQAYFNGLSSPRFVAVVADLAVLTGLAFAVLMRGLPRLAGAVLAGAVGLALLAFNGTWLWPWQALSILALMFTGTMLHRAEQGQYPWRHAIAAAVTVLGLVVVAGLWHSREMGWSAATELTWQRTWFVSVTLAGLTFGLGLAFRHVRWPRGLTWTGLISYSLYLLHPQLIDVFRHMPWTSRHHSLWPQLLVDAVFLVVLIAMCSLTYLLVERPLQDAGRRLARGLDTRYGPDRVPPGPAPAAAEPVPARHSRAVTD